MGLRQAAKASHLFVTEVTEVRCITFDTWPSCGADHLTTPLLLLGISVPACLPVHRPLVVSERKTKSGSGKCREDVPWALGTLRATPCVEEGEHVARGESIVENGIVPYLPSAFLEHILNVDPPQITGAGRLCVSTVRRAFRSRRAELKGNTRC